MATSNAIPTIAHSFAEQALVDVIVSCTVPCDADVALVVSVVGVMGTEEADMTLCLFAGAMDVLSDRSSNFEARITPEVRVCILAWKRAFSKIHSAAIAWMDMLAM